jgi:hypothetical protein
MGGIRQIILGGTTIITMGRGWVVTSCCTTIAAVQMENKVDKGSATDGAKFPGLLVTVPVPTSSHGDNFFLLSISLLTSLGKKNQAVTGQERHTGDAVGSCACTFWYMVDRKWRQKEE